jgi:hypothetical protein
MATTDANAGTSTHLLDKHGAFLSAADEGEVLGRLVADFDVADLALRTCLCSRRLDGFDEYHAHLVSVLEEP